MSCAKFEKPGVPPLCKEIRIRDDRMNQMPIRVRLTLWYCCIFGFILMGVVSTLYYAHQAAHFAEMDRSLTSISFHILDELEKDLVHGKTLAQAHLRYDGMSMDDLYVIVRNSSGEQVAANVNITDNQFNPNLQQKELVYTITDSSIGRIRMMIRPVMVDNRIVGYLETGISLKQLDKALFRFKWFIAGISAVGLLLAIIGGWIVAKKFLHRVELISQTARKIAASQGFDQRVLHSGPKDEIGELVETFNDMLTSLEKAYMSQKRFIADASHELRAPLTTIRGNIDILQKMKNIPKEEQSEILKDMQSEAVRMSKLVGNLLSLARADAGQEFRFQSVDLSKLMLEVTTEAKSWNRKVEIQCKVRSETMVWGDPDLLKQLILILVENAIRYTPEGGHVWLSVCAAKEWITFKIKDNGIGIQKDEIAFIFERFFRSDRARLQSPEGTGLGLSIAKWIVEQHQGSIFVESEPNQGTEFTIQFHAIIK